MHVMLPAWMEGINTPIERVELKHYPHPPFFSFSKTSHAASTCCVFCRLPKRRKRHSHEDGLFLFPKSLHGSSYGVLCSILRSFEKYVYESISFFPKYIYPQHMEICALSQKKTSFFCASLPSKAHITTPHGDLAVSKTSLHEPKFFFFRMLNGPRHERRVSGV
jgi:hypothetical protein